MFISTHIDSGLIYSLKLNQLPIIQASDWGAGVHQYIISSMKINLSSCIRLLLFLIFKILSSSKYVEKYKKT